MDFLRPSAVGARGVDLLTANRYTYVNGDPINHHDPTGHCKKTWNPFEAAGECVRKVRDAGSDAADAFADAVAGFKRELETLLAKAQRAARAAAARAAEAAKDAFSEQLEETLSRVATAADYVAESTVRRVQNPLQTVFDVGTGTVVIETVSAGLAIAGGGTLQDENCPRDAECFVGVPTPQTAITLGHTVLVDTPGGLSPELGVHEGQHVRDVEELGGTGFYVGYGLECARRFLSGDDCYQDSIFEQRAEVAEAGGTVDHLLPWNRWTLGGPSTTCESEPLFPLFPVTPRFPIPGRC